MSAKLDKGMSKPPTSAVMTYDLFEQIVEQSSREELELLSSLLVAHLKSAPAVPPEEPETPNQERSIIE